MILAMPRNASVPHSAEPVPKKSSRWGIVLAGGEGRRMSPLVNHWLGENRPKQYCTFVGSRSMFQHTIDRARSIVPDDNIVSVIGREHRRFLPSATDRPVPGTVIELPYNLGTAPGLFLPLAHILARDPDASVFFLPSDHYVYPEERFGLHVVRACALADTHRDHLILVAAIPDRPETDYGWIEPAPLRRQGRATAGAAMKVLTFREKPGVIESFDLFKRGCLWNTMVMAGRAKTLWELGRRCLPEMMNWFDAYLLVLCDVQSGHLGPEMETLAPLRLYEELGPADFSKDILQHAADRSMVLPMEGVEWCDWGSPRRVTETLAHLDRQPLFPREHVDADEFQGHALCENRT